MKAVNYYSNVLLIGPVTIKQQSVINENVEEQDIFNAVLSTQNIDLQNIIGNRLLWKLQELISTIEISNEQYLKYRILLDEYITPYMISVITFKILPIIQYKLRNKGVVTTNDEHVNNVNYSDLKNLTELYRVEATQYANMLKKFLCKNSSDFPELNCDENTIICPDLGKQYSTPFVI